MKADPRESEPRNELAAAPSLLKGALFVIKYAQQGNGGAPLFIVVHQMLDKLHECSTRHRRRRTLPPLFVKLALFLPVAVEAWREQSEHVHSKINLALPCETGSTCAILHKQGFGKGARTICPRRKSSWIRHHLTMSSRGVAPLIRALRCTISMIGGFRCVALPMTRNRVGIRRGFVRGTMFYNVVSISAVQAIGLRSNCSILVERLDVLEALQEIPMKRSPETRDNTRLERRPSSSPVAVKSHIILQSLEGAT